jgi:hypothetical protein
LRKIPTLADVAATHSTAAVTLTDAVAAAETLRVTAIHPHSLDARLCTLDGGQFATYLGAALEECVVTREDAVPPGVDAMAMFEANHLRVVWPIALNGHTIGRITVEPDTTEVWTRLAPFMLLAAATLFVGFWIALRPGARQRH